MNRITKALKQKKGMTLIETVVTLLIAGIFIAGTGALIISGLNLFQDTASRNLDQQIGDSVMEVVRDNLEYARTIETGPDTSPFSEEEIGTAGAIFVGDGINSPQDSGELYMKRYGAGEEFYAVYPGGNFYSGRELALELSIDKVSYPKAVTLTVKVLSDGKVKYNRSTSFQLLNSGDSDSPLNPTTINAGKIIMFTNAE